MSKGSLSTAYLGEFVPGGKTSGGLTEGILSQSKYKIDGKVNPKIELVSFSVNMTTDKLKAKADKL